MRSAVWIFAFFGLMVIGVMVYLVVTGEFYNFPVLIQLASQLGVSQHDLGTFFFMLIVFGIPTIFLPLFLIVILVTRE